MAEKPKEKPKAKSKPSKSKSTAGKGDNPRNCFSDDYRDNYDDSNKIRSSTGVTIDWFTPIGPLNVSLAQPLSQVSTDKTETFQNPKRLYKETSQTAFLKWDVMI